jgi:hypothetical protein
MLVVREPREKRLTVCPYSDVDKPPSTASTWPLT